MQMIIIFFYDQQFRYSKFLELTIIIIPSSIIQLMDNSSLGDCNTQAKRKVQKIQLNFQDNIYNTKRFKLTFFPWIRTGQLKKSLIKEKFNDKNRQLSQKDIRLFYKNIELTKENKNCFDYYKIDSGSTIIIMKNTNQHHIQNGVINPYQIFEKVPPQINNLLMNIQSGLNACRKPKLASQGTSGTYFLENHNKKIVAVYKPFDEEPYTPNNPRNFTGQLGTQGIRKGILSGESATREVAAYLLDSTHFHQVPATTYVQFYHPCFSYNKVCQKDPILSNKEGDLKALRTKHGSLQQFVQYFDVVGNLGSHQFDINQVHKIAILDLRILNCDRNEANILVVKKLVNDSKSKQTLKITNLVPIDHGLSFPDNFEIYDHQIVWMSYKQTQMPLSQQSLQFVQDIDPVKDCQMLRNKLGFREICLRNFRISQIFLKKMVKAKFTLKQIGAFMYRNDDYSDNSDNSDQENNPKPKKSQFSELQRLVKQAQIIFYTVKQNGIKSTVQFQIGLIKQRRQQESNQHFLQIKQINSQQEKIQSPYLNKNKQTSIQKIQKISPKGKPRNVSLPNLIKMDSNVRGKKIRQKKRTNTKQQKKQKQNNQNWGDVFFHYFQDLLDRFMVQKLKIRIKPTPIGGRGRLMSQNISL